MKKFENLKFTDHYMFEKVLQNHEICKELLERLLKIKIDHLEYPEIEKTISPYYETRGVRLDVYLKDSDRFLILNYKIQLILICLCEQDFINQCLILIIF